MGQRLLPAQLARLEGQLPITVPTALHLNRLARLGGRFLDPDQSHDRLLETDRRNLGRSGSRHNLIDAGGSNLPRQLAINPWDHV